MRVAFKRNYSMVTCFVSFKENLKTKITLLTAKFEAQRTRQDSEHRAELERQV